MDSFNEYIEDKGTIAEENSQEDIPQCVSFHNGSVTENTQDNPMDFKFISLKNCWHRVKIECQLAYLKSNPEGGRKCPQRCGVELSQEDYLILDEFVRERHQKANLAK